MFDVEQKKFENNSSFDEIHIYIKERIYNAHQNEIIAIQISKDVFILTGSYDKKIKIWKEMN